MNRLIVNDAACIGCGECIEICPFGALSLQADKAVVNDNCALCGACVSHCAYNALTLHKSSQHGTPHPDSWRGVWVFGEMIDGVLQPVVYELIGEGRKLADVAREQLCVVIFGNDTDDVCDEVLGYPVDRVLQIDAPDFSVYEPGLVSAALTALIQKYKPSVMLAGATAIGRELMPRVATFCHTGLTADCTELAIGSDRLLEQTRPAFGGNIMARILCPHHRPQMATVRHKVFRPALARSATSPRGVVERVVLPAGWEPAPSARLTRTAFQKLVGEVNLAEADVVVCGGIGMGKPENFKLLEELAALLGGTVAATRAAVDRGWMPHERQVGQTGRTVAPGLYIACGISGAVQHVVGMRASQKIVAVNHDPEAPIFNEATVGIVGDSVQVVSEWIRQLKACGGERS